MCHVVVLVDRLVMSIREDREPAAFGLHRERSGSTFACGGYSGDGMLIRV
jgi:hypothetical protein